jgi:DUF971 family protein
VGWLKLGAPSVLSIPKDQLVPSIFRLIAENLDKECDALEKQGNQIPNVRYETGKSLIIVRKYTSAKVRPTGEEKKIKSRELRLRCRCAACIDELSGKALLNERSVPAEVFPGKIEPKGNYAVAIVWSDGHKSSIYPYSLLLSDDIPTAN